MKSVYNNFLIAKYFRTCTNLCRETPTNLKGKKHSSQLWLTRQMRDPYVEKAKKENYRCRSAFKLLEMNERFKILKPGQTVIDCGAAPGSWSQVAVKLTNANGINTDAVGTVIGIDKIPMYPIEGATLLGNMDFTTEVSHKELLKLLKDKKADVVLSDMAPNACGIRDIDHINIIKLAYLAFKFALQTTRIDGTFICKVWDGEKCRQLEQDLLKFYKHVRNVRPEATRDDSTEKFFLATGFKGVKTVSNNAA